MRRRTLVLTVCSLAAFLHLAGCSNYSPDRAGRAWERAVTSHHSVAPSGPDGYMSASDGLGYVVFAGDVAPEAGARSAFTQVPTE